MFKTTNPYLKNIDYLEGENALRVNHNESRILSLMFCLIVAVSYILPYLVIGALNDTVSVIFIIGSFIISLSSFVLGLKIKRLETLLTITNMVFTAFFLGLTSEFFRLLILDRFNSYDGYIINAFTASIIASITVSTLIEYLFGNYVRNFFFRFLIGYGVLLTIAILMMLSINSSTQSFPLAKCILVAAFFSLLVMFIATIYYENTRFMIIDGVKKNNTWRISFSIIALITWFLIDLFYLIKYSFGKRK
ncbi:MAG: hypothetical protein K6G38_05935 [Gammaproteobacteria bacterium]|nr:hypothetical protein [Gammaproteobacteria bacterium]